jgi:hypothetical protein
VLFLDTTTKRVPHPSRFSKGGNHGLLERVSGCRDFDAVLAHPFAQTAKEWGTHSDVASASATRRRDLITVIEISLRQQPSKVPNTPSSRTMAGSNPIAHHHLSLIAAQRNPIGDARLIRMSVHESGLTVWAHTDLNVLTHISMTKPAIVAASAATPSLRSFTHATLDVICLHFRARGPPFGCRHHHERGCPILAHFARVGTSDSCSRVRVLKPIEVCAAHPFAQTAKGWGTHNGDGPPVQKAGPPRAGTALTRGGIQRRDRRRRRSHRPTQSSLSDARAEALALQKTMQPLARSAAGMPTSLARTKTVVAKRE